MADFEDANSPTWENCIEGQRNLTDALERTIELDTGEKRYTLNDEVAVLFVRPRGWHLEERHFEVDGAPMSGSLFDFGLYFLRNHGRNGRYFYLPKLESHLEARLWNDVFGWAQERLGVERGTIKATVLIETILAAFEMDEILYELRDHSAGLNAGPLGLHLQRDQEARPPTRVRAPGPGGRDDGRPVHALLLRAARQDVPPARRARDGRDGGVHPLPPRRRGERGRAREGARGQGARGVPGLRRDVGRAPRSRPGRDGVVRRRCSATGRTRSTGSATTWSPRRGSPRRRGHPRRDHRGRAPQQRLGRDPVPRRVAAGRRRGRDQQPHGGRGDGGDLAFADLAMAPPRPRRPRTTFGGSPTRRSRASARATTTRARCSSASRHSPTTSSSSRCPPTTGCSRSSRPDHPQGRSDAQGSSAATSTAA